MECEKCGSMMRIVLSAFESEQGSTDVYAVQHLVCANPDCEGSKAGLVTFVRNKLN